MTWHEKCSDFDSRIEAASKDAIFNDITFLLVQPDADNPSGDEVSANKAILALISPVFFAQFYGPLSDGNEVPLKIVDGTAKGFKQLINFILNPKSYELKVENVTEVFDICFFGHKYQIGSLISHCRQFLGGYDMKGEALDTLNWALSSQNGSETKTALPSEHALLVHSCWRKIDSDFVDIFANEDKHDEIVMDEEVMLTILRCVQADEDFVLMVTLDYYVKWMEKWQKGLKSKKKIKLNIENKWNAKLERIKSVIDLENICPQQLNKVILKFENKVPDKVILSITKQMTESWEKNKSYKYRPKERIGVRLNLKEEYEGGLDLDDDDWIHDTNFTAKIKFKANRDAILHFDPTGFSIVKCECHETEPDCCIYDSLVFQSEGDFKEEVSIRRANGDETNADGSEFNFYVREDKEVTLSFKRRCNKETCALHLEKMNSFTLFDDDEYGYFEVVILEVNGQPITEPCYSFLRRIDFTPIYFFDDDFLDII